MSRSRALVRWIPIVILALLLISESIAASAAPATAPVLGFTPTPTSTPKPTRKPTRKPSEREPDPVIIKRVDPAEAEPGDEVTFTILVTNEGEVAAVGVVVTDDIPEYLEILEVTTTQGTWTIQGQRVIVEVGTVGPDFWVEIVIRTRVRDDTPAPLTLENVAVLTCANCFERRARVTLKIIGPLLPKTGGLSTWWLVAACLGTGLVALSLALSKRGRG